MIIKTYFMKQGIFLILFSLFLGSIHSQNPQLYQASDFIFVGDFSQGLEGPAVDHLGNLYFVNPIRNGTIGKIDTEGNFSVLIDSLPDNSVGNGIRISADGKLYVADYTNHNVLKVDPTTGTVSVHAYQPKANQPNDLAICCGGRLYASDPNWSDNTGNIWMVEKGQFIKLQENMGTTNGIEISPDFQTLYVNESIQLKVWAFDILPNGHLVNKRLHIEFEDYGLDGMRIDTKGNLYITRYGKGSIVKVSPEGEIIREIFLKGKRVSNLAFGGKDGKTVFVTTQDRGWIETFQTEYSGRSFLETKKNAEINSLLKHQGL